MQDGTTAAAGRGRRAREGVVAALALLFGVLAAPLSAAAATPAHQPGAGLARSAVAAPAARTGGAERRAATARGGATRAERQQHRAPARSDVSGVRALASPAGAPHDGLLALAPAPAAATFCAPLGYVAGAQPGARDTGTGHARVGQGRAPPRETGCTVHPLPRPA